MKKQIFITNGMARVGKDTFAALMGEFVSVLKISSIDIVKDIAKDCGWDGGKTEKDRKFLSDMKCLLTEYNDFPFETLRKQVQHFLNNDHPEPEILIIDIREPAEIERAKQEFGAKTILITNDHIAPITSNMADAGVFNYSYDYVLDNSGTIEQFREIVRYFVELFVRGEE